MAKSTPLSVFCSYSQKDETLRAQVATGLASLVREGLIREAWYDQMTIPGEGWANVLHRNLEESDIILFLVSSNFIASDYCMGIEVARAMDRHKKGEARVVPIILEPCDWKNLAFAEIQSLPPKGEPLRSWTIVNKKRLLEVSQGVRKAVVELLATSASKPSRPAASAQDASQTVLAYLCNRVEQDEQLKKAWSRHYNVLPLRRRPFVCVVHGPVREDHPGYFQRLWTYSFPREIGQGRDFVVNRPARIRWPEDCADKASAFAAMKVSLAKEFNFSGELEGIPNVLYQLGETCVVYCEVHSRTKSYGSRVAVESFFDLWKEWPDLPSRQKLIVVLSVQYQPGAPVYFPKQDVEIVSNATAGGRLSAVVLEELPPVSAEHVKGWIRHPEVERYCDVETYLEIWEAQIDDTFGDRSQIPMEQLVGPLNRMLNEYQRRLA